MKVLTLVSVILLPATVLGGIMGMNFQVGLFDQAWVFWVVIAAMLGIAVVVLFGRPRPRLDLRPGRGPHGTPRTTLPTPGEVRPSVRVA
jgi:uncharacterized membrane protein YfcA